MPFFLVSFFTFFRLFHQNDFSTIFIITITERSDAYGNRLTFLKGVIKAVTVTENTTTTTTRLYYVCDLYQFEMSTHYFYSFQWFKTAKDRNRYLRNRKISTTHILVKTTKGEGGFSEKTGKLVPYDLKL